MSWLSDHLERSVAQVVPFDGKTANSVSIRQKNRKLPPVRPQYSGAIPKQDITGGFTGLQPGQGQIVQQGAQGAPFYEPSKQYQYANFAVPYDTTNLPQEIPTLRKILR